MNPYNFSLNQPRIIVNNYVRPNLKTWQFRLPKSKKKRIRNKWAKNKCNFKSEMVNNFLFDKQNNIIYINQDDYDKLISSLKSEVHYRLATELQP